MNLPNNDNTDVTPDWYIKGLSYPSATSEIEVAGVPISFETWGDRSKPGVVLIHGSNAHKEWWRFVAPVLADQFRVAAIDLSGNGDSGWRERYTGQLFAQEVYEVCQAAHLGDKPFVVGHSFGGWVALQTAYYYGSELSGVIFNDYTVAPPERYVEWGLRVEREGVDPSRPTRVYPDIDTAMSRFRFIPEQPTRFPEVIDYIGRQGLREVEGGVTWKFDPGMYDYLEMGADQRERFASVACRSAVILGELTEDEGAYEGDYMRELCKGGLPVFELPGCHHHMMFEEPIALAMAFKGLMLNWLAEDNRSAMRGALAEVLTNAANQGASAK